MTALRAGAELVVVEGPMDALAVNTATGHQGTVAVATGGTSLTRQHLTTARWRPQDIGTPEARLNLLHAAAPAVFNMTVEQRHRQTQRLSSSLNLKIGTVFDEIRDQGAKAPNYFARDQSDLQLPPKPILTSAIKLKADTAIGEPFNPTSMTENVLPCQTAEEIPYRSIPVDQQSELDQGR